MSTQKVSPPMDALDLDLELGENSMFDYTNPPNLPHHGFNPHSQAYPPQYVPDKSLEFIQSHFFASQAIDNPHFQGTVDPSWLQTQSHSTGSTHGSSNTFSSLESKNWDDPPGPIPTPNYPLMPDLQAEQQRSEPVTKSGKTYPSYWSISKF